MKTLSTNAVLIGTQSELLDVALYFEVHKMPWLHRVAATALARLARDHYEFPDAFPLEYVERITRRFRMGDYFIACLIVLTKTA